MEIFINDNKRLHAKEECRELHIITAFKITQ